MERWAALSAICILVAMIMYLYVDAMGLHREIEALKAEGKTEREGQGNAFDYQLSLVNRIFDLESKVSRLESRDVASKEDDSNAVVAKLQFDVEELRTKADLLCDAVLMLIKCGSAAECDGWTEYLRIMSNESWLDTLDDAPKALKGLW